MNKKYETNYDKNKRKTLFVWQTTNMLKCFIDNSYIKIFESSLFDDKEVDFNINKYFNFVTEALNYTKNLFLENVDDVWNHCNVLLEAFPKEDELVNLLELYDRDLFCEMIDQNRRNKSKREIENEKYAQELELQTEKMEAVAYLENLAVLGTTDLEDQEVVEKFKSKLTEEDLEYIELVKSLNLSAKKKESQESQESS